MTKIYIDTNIFLDFYQSTTDRLSIFEEIEKHSLNIVLTQQTINEFRRNKKSQLNELAKNIKNTSAVSMHNTALVQSLPEFKAWSEAKKNAEKFSGEIAKKLLTWSQDESSDPVHVAFEGLVSKSTILPTEENSIKKAKLRKILGNPPTSPDRYTIGDELIWETLLASCHEDLIIVSRDKTFLENTALLKMEYATATNAKLISITPKLGDAFQKIGSPSDAVMKAEQQIEDNKNKVRYPYSLTTSTKCPNCGGELEETRYKGSDGDSMWWVFCTRCGTEYFPDQFAQ